jgi:hypothetical protein
MTMAFGQKTFGQQTFENTAFVWHCYDPDIWSKNTWPTDIRQIQLLFGTVMTLAFTLKTFG